MIELVLNTWMLESGVVALSVPVPTTSLSTLNVPAMISMITTIDVTMYVVERAIGGSGVAMTAAVGDWNSSTGSGRASSSPVLRAWLVALGKSWRRRSIIESFRREVAVLLEPQMTVDGAALHQFVMRADIDRAAAVEHHDQVTIEQRGEAVRDDHHRAPLGDAQDVGVHQRLALRVQRGG